jgi:hypothetical protein
VETDETASASVAEPDSETDDSIFDSIVGIEEPVALPFFKAIVLDNDETTGSYGIVFSLLTYLRKIDTIDDDFAELLYIRLAIQMRKYNLFRPKLGHLLRTLAFLRDEGAIDAVIMYTNQTEEYPYNPYGPFRNLLYNVPYTISYLMYSAYGVHIIRDVLSRPPFLRGLKNAACTKSFTRIFALEPDRVKDTRDILFVDDNASRSFITASKDTVTHDGSYYKIGAYVRVLTDEELDALLGAVFESVTVDEGTIAGIKQQYRVYSPLSKLEKNNVDDKELAVLNKVVVEKYI